MKRFVPARAGLVLAVAAALTAASCAGPVAGPAAPQAPDPAPQALVTAPWLDSAVEIPDGQIDAAVDRLDGLAEAIMADTGQPGMAVAVVAGGEVVYAKGFGVRKVGSPDRVDADTVFQLASMSKAIGATVVAHEVTEGTVRWNTRIKTNRPSFELSDPWVSDHVTIADAYAHRTGLPEHAGDLLEDLGYSRSEIIRRLRYLELNPFRAKYGYTNFGMSAAAYSVAKAAGKDWADLSEDVLYEPLGMGSTSSRYADYAARSNRAWTHVPTDDGYRAKVVRKPDAQTPAGGVSSSVNDLTKWMLMLLGNGTAPGGPTIASEEALTPAVTPQIVIDTAPSSASRPGYYGYGFDVASAASGRQTFSHSGAFSAGAATNVILLPSAGVGIVTVSNAYPTGAVETLNQEFMDLVQYGQPRTDWATLYKNAYARLSAPFGSLAGQDPPADPAPAAAARLYRGTYSNDYVGTARVRTVDGGLVLELGPKKLRYPLRHWSGDVYTYEPSGENAMPGSVSTVTFRQSGSKRATSIDIEFYAQDGQGVLDRR